MFEIKMTEKEIVDGLRSNYGKEFTAPDVRGFCAANDIAYQTVTKKIEQYKVGRGKWNLEVTTKAVQNIEKSFSAPAVEPTVQQNLVPNQDDAFVKFGPFNDVKAILKSKQFYPTFITGLSGNGKTFGVEQACAQLGKKYGQDAVLTQTKKTGTVSATRKGGLGKDSQGRNVKRIKAGKFKPGQTSPEGDTQIKKKTFAYKK